MGAFESVLAIARDDVLRLSGIAYLSSFPAQWSLEPLLGFASNRDHQVRRAAASGLGELGDRRALPLLRRMLNDPDVSVQGAAQEAIRKIEAK